MAKTKTDATKKATKAVKKAVKKDGVKSYYEAESWQFSGCGD